MSWAENWKARANARHNEGVAEGLHDFECEWRPDGHFLCHCSKRRRLAEGRTTPPRILFNYPTCDDCQGMVHPDGDGWVCPPCRAYWSSDAVDGDRGQFTDDYGTLDPEGWRRP